jgi:hypothetical protein
MRLTHLIHHLTVPCADNGKKFPQTEHINRTDLILCARTRELVALGLQEKLQAQALRLFQ